MTSRRMWGEQPCEIGADGMWDGERVMHVRMEEGQSGGECDEGRGVGVSAEREIREER